MSFNLKSSTEEKSLSLRLLEEEYIEIKIEGVDLNICHKSYLYTDGNALKNFFKDLADNWKGWGGDKEWSSIEDDFTLSASFKSTGHVLLTVNLVHNPGGDDSWEYKTTFDLECGQLDNVYKSISKEL